MCGGSYDRWGGPPKDATAEEMAQYAIDKAKWTEKDILEENMSTIKETLPRKTKDGDIEYDNDGMYVLRVEPEDDDAKHIPQHAEFLKEHREQMTPQSRARMQLHIDKHEIQLEEKGY